MESTRFKSDPYNPLNRLITSKDVDDIFTSLHMSPPKISDITLYQRAFIHKSYTQLKDYEEYHIPPACLELCKESYETMEFLGDSIVGSVVSVYLYDRYVDMFKVDEGFLTKLKIRFVCGEHLGHLSKQLKLSPYLIISKHIDENCGGRDNIHLLEDIYEAFVGAIYLDSKDMDLAREFIIQSIELHTDISDVISKDNNYKDQILRYFQHNYKVHPSYETGKKEGTDSFVCRLLKEGVMIVLGEGSTKKKAEQDASKKALQKYHILS
jgi:ribonuclease-3